MNIVIRFLRHALRLLLRVVAVLLFLIVLLVILIGFTPFGARIAAEKVAGLVSKPGQIVTIATPSGLLTGALRVPQITLADSKGVYATIDNLAVDWSPSALITATFKAEGITAEHVSVLRAPIPEPVEEPASTEPFKLPVKLDINKIEAPDIRIGKALAGHDFALSASGSGSADQENIIIKLAANRQDIVEAKALVDLAFVPGENRLTIAASLDEPKDGMLAGLLDLPGRPAMHLTVDGSGPLSDWKGDLTAALDGNRAFTATASHQAVADGGHRLVLSGNGQAQPLMPATARALFAGNTDFTLDATLGTAGSVVVKSGTLATSSLRLAISGTYDPNGNNDLTAHAEGVTGPVEIVVPAGKDKARLLLQSVDLALKGQAKAAALTFGGTVASVDYPGYRVDGIVISGKSDALDLQTRTGKADVTLSFERGTFADPNIQRLVPGPLTLRAPLSLSPQAIAFEGAELESARLGGSASGAYDLVNNTVQSDVKLFLLPAVLPDGLVAKVKDTISLAGSVAYGPNGAVSASGLSLQSDVLTVTGEAGLADGQLRADLKGTLPELGILLADAKGAAGFTVSASGSPGAPDFTAELTSEKAVLSGRTLQSLTVKASGKADAKAPSATVSATGSLAGQTVSVNADLKSEGGVTSLPVLSADIGKNHLEGALRFSPDFLPEGAIRFNLPDVGLVAALAGQKAAGDIQGEARFAQSGGIASAKITASGKSLSRDALVIKAPKVALDVADLKTLAAEGTIEAAEIASGANRLSKLLLAFNRQGEQTTFDLTAGYDGKPVAVKGGVTVAGGRTNVALSTVTASPKGVALKLAKPTSILIENGVATLSGLTINAGSGSVAVAGTAGQTLKLAVDLRSLPLNLANAIAPALKAEGSLSGKVTVSGKASNPVVDYALTLDRFALDQTRAAGLQPLAIKADGRLENNRLRLNTAVSNGDGLQVKGGGSLAITGNQALDMAFSGSLPFKALSGVLAAQGLEVSGTAKADVKIAGTVAAPVVTGRITSSDGRVVDVRRNLAIQNLTLSVNLDRTRATVERLSGKLSTGGTVSVTGSVGIQPGSGFPADLKVALDKAAYVDGKVVSTVIDGNLALTGPLLNNPKLSGKLALGRSAITIPQKLPASLSKINVQHRNESKAIASQNVDVMSRDGSGKKSSSSQIGLDLVISAPRIFVQGRGIDAELGGDLTLSGTASSPVISGGFKMKRGRMTIISRRLDFTTGTITFGGDLTPTLAMAAEADSGSVTVTVSIDGPANDPAITFSSSPSLPQDEVLAQLIFQQSLSRLSVLQIAQLADAAAQLAGGRSTSLLQGLRSNLGIDDLDVSSDADGQAQVKAGKYLNDRTYIQVEQGASSGSKASINLDVGRGVKLKGEAGTDGGSAAGIFYEKEY